MKPSVEPLDKYDKKKNDDDSLESVLSKVDLSEKTEMQGVAQEIFHPGDERSDLHHNEVALILCCDIIFPALGVKRLNPTDNFKRLAKSRDGWAANKLVEAAGGIRDSRSGGTIGGWILRDKFMTPKTSVR